MANWNNPTGSSAYADFLLWMKALATDAATFFVSSPTNTPRGAMRYERSLKKFQEWDGAAWVDKIISIEGGGTNAITASAARTSLGLGGLATLSAVTNSEITAVDISKVTGKGALASLNTVGNAEITAVALAKVTGAGTLAGLNSITDANISSPVGLTKGGHGATDAAGARAALGLSSMATQASSSVSITGGAMSGVLGVATDGANSNITSLSGLTGVMGAHVTIRADAITPISAGGANLGDSTYDFNGIRCRAIAPILGQKVQWYTDSGITTGVSCNLDSAIAQFSPIGTMRLGVSNPWDYIYANNALVVTSDIRLKTKMEKLSNCLEMVSKLAPKRYEKGGKTEIGLIAQAVEEVVPEAVRVGDSADELTSEGTPWGVQYEMLIPILIGAIQELQKEIEELKKK